jgi:hypothetical protein
MRRRSRRLLADLRSPVPHRDPDDDEFGGPHGGDADLDDELAELLEGGRVVLVVDLDVEGLRGGLAEQRSGSPDAREELADRAIELLPEGLVVGLEDGPLDPLLDRLLDEDEEPADVDVLPGDLVRGRGRAGAPDDRSLTGEDPQAIDAFNVDLALIAIAEIAFQVHRAGDEFVGGCLMHAALGIAA